MKDINQLKDYRTKYKRFYNIEFGKEYAIHHIDFDRTNNDISNLVLLPTELHSKYHLIINALSICPQKPKADGIIDVRLSNFLITDYNAKMFDLLPETVAECRKWIKWRDEHYSGALRKVIFDERWKDGGK